MSAMTTGSSEVPGLSYTTEFLSTAEEAEILVYLRGCTAWEEIRFRGQIARRMSLSFGHAYQAIGRRLATAPPFPDFLRRLADRAASLAGEAPGHFSQAIVARYPAGAGIGWHRDA